MTADKSDPWEPSESTSLELNEASLLEAIKNIRSFASEDELRALKPAKLIVTEQGIANTRYRYATEAWFRDAVRERAARDPEYRKVCEYAGLILEPDEDKP